MESIRQQVDKYKKDVNLKIYLDWFIAFLDKHPYWDNVHVFTLKSITKSKTPNEFVFQLFKDFDFIPDITSWTQEIDLYKHVGEARLLHSIILNTIYVGDIESRAKKYLEKIAPTIKAHDDRVYELEEQNRTFYTYIKLLKGHLKEIQLPAHLDMEWVGEDVLKAPPSIQYIIVNTMNRIFNKQEEDEEEEDLFTGTTDDEEEEEEEVEHKNTPYSRTK